MPTQRLVRYQVSDRDSTHITVWIFLRRVASKDHCCANVGKLHNNYTVELFCKIEPMYITRDARCKQYNATALFFLQNVRLFTALQVLDDDPDGVSSKAPHTCAR